MLVVSQVYLYCNYLLITMEKRPGGYAGPFSMLRAKRPSGS
jgi:hypothetical protein